MKSYPPYVPRPGQTVEERRHCLVMAKIVELAGRRVKGGETRLVPKGGFDYEGIARKV